MKQKEKGKLFSSMGKKTGLVLIRSPKRSAGTWETKEVKEGGGGKESVKGEGRRGASQGKEESSA